MLLSLPTIWHTAGMKKVWFGVLVWFGLGYCLLGGGASVAIAASEAAEYPDDCADLQFVFARGSGQKLNASDE